MKITKIPLFVGLCLLSNCATSIKYNVGDTPTNKRKIEIVDERDDIQKKSKIMSMSVSNCWYGIYRVGDDQLVPDRMEILAEKMTKNGGDKIDGKKIIVKRFEVYNNIQKDLRKVAVASAFGLAGYLLKDHINAGGCADAFALDQNPDNKPSTIVLVEAEFNGKLIKEKIVQIEPDSAGSNDLRSENVKKRIRLGVNAAADIISSKAFN